MRKTRLETFLEKKGILNEVIEIKEENEVFNQEK